MKDLIKAINYHKLQAKLMDKVGYHTLARQHEEMAKTLEIHLMVKY